MATQDREVSPQHKYLLVAKRCQSLLTGLKPTWNDPFGSGKTTESTFFESAEMSTVSINYFILKIMTLSLTEKAASQLTKFLEDSNKGIRISVVDGGCSGYEYSLNVANAPKTDDLMLQKGNLQIFIDPKSAPLLDGVIVDYIEGLTESGLKFINPNATETCSCGKSFQAGSCTPTAVPCS